MCILKGFSQFVMSFDVQNGFIFESFSFEQHFVEEVILFSDVSAVNLMVGGIF